MGSRPKVVSVTGGKGGTGKSTVAILLAFKATKEGKKVLLMDLDVECPNDYIILGQDKPGRLLKETFAKYPEIDSNKCIKCGTCVSSCTSNALIRAPNSVPKLNKILCSSCGVCWEVCPQDAITPKKEQNGEVFINELAENLTLATGKSKAGVRETSPVVSETKKELRPHYPEYDLVIIDTAAGTHCNVINALENSDFAVAVTEPTPLGKHDLGVILSVMDVLKIKYDVVVNQYDVGDFSLIEDSLSKRKIDKVGKVPYSKELAKIYSGGEFLENQELAKLLDYELKQ